MAKRDKWTVSRDFRPLIALNIRPVPYMNWQKLFRKLVRYHEDIRSQRSKIVCPRSQPTHVFREYLLENETFRETVFSLHTYGAQVELC